MAETILINDDCISALKSIPSSSIDLVLTDPPYGVTANKWDSVIDFASMWSQINRVIRKDRAIVLFSSQPFTTKLIQSNDKNFKYCWYWIKNQSTNFFHAARMPTRKVEEILVFNAKNTYYPQMTEGCEPTNSAVGSSNGSVYYGDNKRDYAGGSTTRFPTNVLEFKCVDNYSRQHPNQKPVELLEYLIKTYTTKGETVLDFTMGSGSTGVAAISTGRSFIGIESDASYFETAKLRMSK